MNYFILSRRLRSQDLLWLQKQSEAQLVVFGQALLSDFSPVDRSVKVFALQEEVKETGLVPQFEGTLELKSAGELIELLMQSKLIHL